MSLTVFEELKSNFKAIFENAPNKNNLVENEISEIERFLEPKVEHTPITALAGGSGSAPNRTSLHVFKIVVPKGLNELFALAFRYSYVEGNYNYTPLPNEPESLVQQKLMVVRQAEELAKFYSWLKNLRFDNDSKKRVKSEAELTHKEKLLALYYMGLRFNDEYEKTKYAKILSLIIEEKEESTRQHLSYFHTTGNTSKKVKTEKGLKRLKKLFESLEFGEELKLVKKDLEDL
ncbi:hypothetical protein J4E06_04850 [Muricauda sp. NFXS6]|uniref:hypothetical protein n=1 Tax=Allomuricauda sp. NFXS6 TaxID=2819094 RepID=UPI0032DEC540